jgi:hypothetical protein
MRAAIGDFLSRLAFEGDNAEVLTILLGLFGRYSSCFGGDVPLEPFEHLHKPWRMLEGQTSVHSQHIGVRQQEF